jgi:predicted MFS family arabinose efflux permease
VTRFDVRESGRSYGAHRDTESTGKDSSLTTVTEGVRSTLADQMHGRLYVWYVIGLLALVNAFNYMDRTALSMLMPSIKSELNLSDTQLGLLRGFAFSLMYAIAGIPIAWWADHGSRRNVIALALATWSVMTAVSGAAQNFWHLFAARVGIGVGEAGCLPPAQSILCDYVPVNRRAGIFALHGFGLIVGMMAAMSLSGVLAEAIGWRLTFVALGIPGIVLAVIVRVTLREPVRGLLDTAKRDEHGSSFGDVLRYLWRCKTYRLLACFLTVNGFVQYGLYQWWPTLYVRVFGLSLPSVGVYLGIAIAVGSAVGLLSGGALANSLAQRHVRLPLVLSAAATLLALPAAMVLPFAPTALSSMVLVAVTVVFWSVTTGPVVAAVYSVAPPQMRATAGTITIFFTSVIGFGLGPLCVGFLSDHLAPSYGPAALRYALLVPSCLHPVMTFALLAASRKLAQDLKTAGGRI